MDKFVPTDVICNLHERRKIKLIQISIFCEQKYLLQITKKRDSCLFFDINQPSNLVERDKLRDLLIFPILLPTPEYVPV